MGTILAAEIDAWLHDGGLVVTASDRAARALTSAFHRARQADELTAWPSPSILDWKTFVRGAWEERTLDGRLLLNPLQEQSLWATIAGADGQSATLLEGPRHRLAALAIEAHELLCAYAPRSLRPSARAGWQHDAAVFSRWLTAFDDSCRDANLLSPARLPLELIPLLEGTSNAEAPPRAPTIPRSSAEWVGNHEPHPASDPTEAPNLTQRPPLLLVGFDRIQPIHRALFDAWGEWQQTALDPPAEQLQFYEAPDSQAELAACALWCNRQLAANPRARLLVITQDAASRRGEIERAFLQHSSPAASPRFEFSLGIPLSQVAIPHSAHLLLRWLSGQLAEHEVDWLLSTGYAAASSQESSALQAHMRSLRRRSLEQPYWTLPDFIAQHSSAPPPPAWVDRITAAQRRLTDLARRLQTPLEWAEFVPHLLEAAAFTHAYPLSSAEHQALNRWSHTLETCGSLGFDGRRIPWHEFLSILGRALDETLFAPESRDAPIQIAGPAESAGLTADAVWFLGADEDAWPPRGSTHPLLPLEVQRQSGMPHATPQLDWDLAQSITTRLISSATEVHFSYAKQNEAAEARPSRLIVQLAGPPRPMPPELTAPPIPAPLTIAFEDFSRIPYTAAAKVDGGAAVLTAQSQCPFKAFATARLAAQPWEPAEAGLTPSQRGTLLHAVLRAIWAGPPHGISTSADLQKLTDQERTSLVARHAQRVLHEKISPSLRRRLPRRYLELEEQRLANLITEWLTHESTRLSFHVVETEADRTIHLAGLTFDLRLDRIDRLNDNSLLVIDYKSGYVTPASWNLPRPDDVQLPLYAGFALEEDQELGGLVFAKVRAGDLAFAGRVGDAKSTLFSSLQNTSSLVKNPLSAEQLIDWREAIEQLAKAFLAGRAEVDPRDYPKTCERCGLQTLCRIQEYQLSPEDEDSDEEAVDERD
ncbi:MAG: PD-(D/E)XK nuclease family protein [Terracidiphilus sp.]